MRHIAIAITLLASALAVASTAAQDAPLPEDSLYALDARFTDANDRRVELRSLRGAPVLITMFYGSCRTMCPLIIEDVRDVERALTPAERSRLRVVLVTFDAERDTAEALREMSRERDLPLDRWTILRGSDADVRELAMVLGIQYRRVGEHIAHNAVLTVLDPDGRVAARLEGVRRPNGVLIERIRSLLGRRAS